MLDLSRFLNCIDRVGENGRVVEHARGLQRGRCCLRIFFHRAASFSAGSRASLGMAREERKFRDPGGLVKLHILACTSRL